MEQHDLERIQFVTRHFDELKGLAGKVPLGLFLIGGFGGLSLGLTPGALLGFASAAGSLWLMCYANVYYSRRFGHVETTGAAGRPRSRISTYVLDGPPLRSIAIATAGVFLAFVPIGLATLFFHSMVCVLWCGWLLVSWVRKRCPASQAYYPVLVLLLLAFARWHGGPISERSFDKTNEVACGAVLVLVGLFDHWQLVRALEPIDEAELAALDEESR